MKTALTAAEIASLGLPGLDPDKPTKVIGDISNVLRRATRHNWPFEARTAPGGGKLYLISGLPQPWRDALTAAIGRGDAKVLDILGIEAPASLPSPPSPPSTALVPARSRGDVVPPGKTDPKTGLPVRHCGRRTMVLAVPDPDTTTARQRAVRDARAALLAEIDRLTAVSGVTKAVRTVVEGARAGTLRPELLALVPVANDRSGADGGRTIAPRTVKYWLAARKAEGVDALAPRPTATVDTSIPEWAPYLMAEYQRPQKPALTDALKDMFLPEGMDRPSYKAASRFLDKLAPFCREKGRMGPNALKALRAFVARDTSELWPTAVYTSDGHTLKAKVEHPIHGGPFQPEVTPVLDVATRYCVSFSAGIVENSIGVLEALSSAMAPPESQPGGVPAIFYTDLGKGFKNDLLSSTATGFYARWGITEKHSRARNSQARGIMEHWHATVLTPLAKSLPTYCGDDMDKDATRLLEKANKDAKKAGQPLPYTVSWPEFLDRLRTAIATYNTTAHSALPKVTDPATGRRRHMTPAEAWAVGVERTGYKPMVVAAEDVPDLMRPYQERVTRRGFVQVLGHDYFSRTLEAFHGDRVRVGFDINDPSRVWVRDIEHGRLLAVAKLDGTRRAYFPTAEVVQARSFSEQRMAARTKGRLARNDANREEILAEAAPQLTLIADAMPLEPEVRRAGEVALERFIAAAPSPPPPAKQVMAMDGRPTAFAEDVDLARWLADHPQQAEDADIVWMRRRLVSGAFRMQLQCADIDIEALRRIVG